MLKFFASSFFCLLTLATATASAQVKVFLDATARDPVGGRLSYAIKEGIRRSAAMELVDREEDGFVGVHLVTLDPDESPAGNHTIYSIVWTTKTLHSRPVTMYLTSSVGICGSDRVPQCAESLVAKTDEQVTYVRSLLQTIIEKAKK